jgi:hypothetical protein
MLLGDTGAKADGWSPKTGEDYLPSNHPIR